MSERMPSHIASVFFTVRVKGAWRPTHDGALDHQEPATLARHHLRQNITRVLCQHSVLHLAAAQDAANTALMRWLRPVAGLEITGAVALTASTSDRDLAEENARRQQTADLEHEDELRRLAHLQRVLADPDLRRVWWIAQYPDRHQELRPLATALKDLPLPHETTDDDIRGEIRRFTDRLLTALHTPQQREVFLKALTQTLHTLGHHDLTAMAAPHWQTHSEPGSTPA
ncbi:hypothetical protein HEP86_39640 [Streptomyces sp. RPA4-5]|uniref:hypothetical protein n=1 Tax=Streptomyces sp. RPA4-5 TaxID=2721245 RepID=UPI00143EB378|nr:hypothetical protein [Streptomyces sp. RPA4-5]QIY59440.1 hypothetical protein HEP86_39640 [Streptomyces sp. RPA4-5]